MAAACKKFSAYPRRFWLALTVTGNGAVAVKSSRIASVSSVEPSSETTTSCGRNVCAARLSSWSRKKRSPFQVASAMEMFTKRQAACVRPLQALRHRPSATTSARLPTMLRVGADEAEQNLHRTGRCRPPLLSSHGRSSELEDLATLSGRRTRSSRGKSEASLRRRLPGGAGGRDEANVDRSDDVRPSASSAWRSKSCLRASVFEMLHEEQQRDREDAR